MIQVSFLSYYTYYEDRKTKDGASLEEFSFQHIQFEKPERHQKWKSPLPQHHQFKLYKFVKCLFVVFLNAYFFLSETETERDRVQGAGKKQKEMKMESEAGSSL